MPGRIVWTTRSASTDLYIPRSFAGSRRLQQGQGRDRIQVLALHCF